MNEAYRKELLTELDELLNDDVQESEWIRRGGAGFHSWTETLVQLENILLCDEVLDELEASEVPTATTDLMRQLRKCLRNLADRYGSAEDAATKVVRDNEFTRARALASEIRTWFLSRL